MPTRRKTYEFGGTERAVERYLVRFGPATATTIADFTGLSRPLVYYGLKKVAEKTSDVRPATWKLKKP